MAADSKVRRCAVYTRKSSEEGLDQDFNSLQAQRESCEAYIRSQRSEGWKLIPAAYDDGGISGGTMARPALQRLLSDIAAGQVDVIVVYKVDRLTRALADFAKMVEVFDRHGVSFVAVTQQFNTTTSMGRLTLNVLLSFAQFEREVTGERIRDKIAASKQKGMWMGGVVPLGYRVKDRKLIVVPEEAERVRLIFSRYLQCSGVPALVRWLRREDIRSRPRGVSPGVCFGRGGLYCLLSNPVYIGEISHKGLRHPGLQEAIVDHAVWGAAQTKMAAKTPYIGSGRRTELSPLLKKLQDSDGRRLHPSHSRKAGRRYRYYVSESIDPDTAVDAKSPDWRLPASDLESRVLDVVRMIVGDQALLAKAALAAELPLEQMAAVLKNAQQSEPSLELVQQVVLGTDSMSVTIQLAASPSLAVEKTVPMAIRRRGHERRLVFLTATERPARPDARLIKALGHGLSFWDRLQSGESLSAVDLGNKEGLDNRYVGRTLALAFLAPDLMEAIALGTLAEGWSAERLLRLENLPLSWVEQRRMFAAG